jgi:hypothetical protein
MRKSVFKLSEVVPVRFESAERDRLKSMASNYGISLSTLIRLVSTNLEIPPQRLSPIDHATLTELSRWGNNLNQVSRAVNTAQLQENIDTATSSQVLKEMSEIAVAIKNIQKKVLS